MNRAALSRSLGGFPFPDKCVNFKMRYVIVDLEATCWDKPTDRSRMEIIEIGAVLLESSDASTGDEFSAFVKPVVEQTLSDFCKQLTSIEQSQIDEADYFWNVFPNFVDWIGTKPFRLCSWGGYDLNQFRADCQRHKIKMPETFEYHINLKRETLLKSHKLSCQSWSVRLSNAAQQFNGREGETATFLSRCPLLFGGLGGGFAPRHLSRWMASL